MATTLTPLRMAIGVAGFVGGCTTLAGDTVYEQHRVAVLAYESGEDARAEALLQGLLRVTPNDAETWLRLGNLYARSARADRAAEAYERALLLTPGDSRLWMNLGVVRQRQALAALLQARELLSPSDPLHAPLVARIERLQAVVPVAADWKGP